MPGHRTLPLEVCRFFIKVKPRTDVDRDTEFIPPGDGAVAPVTEKPRPAVTVQPAAAAEQGSLLVLYGSNIYLELLTPLRPRYYSISSSPLVSPDECSITIGVVKGPAKSGRGEFEGVCSNYLRHQKEGNMIYAFVQDTNSPFHLPEDSRTPIIMIGPGTGLAPFRGFLQERAMQQRAGKQIGTALLFFGCQHPQKDYLYREELENFEKDGVMKLYTAFSRLDPQKKVYVQDKIYEHKDEVWQLLQDGAIVYICGDTTHMVPDVRKTFARVYQEKTGKSEQEANQWLDDLTVKNRYMVDIWGI